MDEISLPHRHGEGRDTLPLARQLSRIEHFQTVADLFKQLDDPTRLRLFWLLCHCEECVVNLSALMNMSSPALSHHLRALKNSGLVVSRRVGPSPSTTRTASGCCACSILRTARSTSRRS